MKFSIPPDRRFVETFAVIRDCSHEAAFSLWRWWHQMLGVAWADETSGSTHEIGTIDGRPVVVTAWWAFIAGKRVAFVDAHSQVVDHELVDKWTQDVFPNRKTSSDVTNFGNVVNAIADALGVQSLIRRDWKSVEDAAQNAKLNATYMKPIAGKPTP